METGQTSLPFSKLGSPGQRDHGCPMSSVSRGAEADTRSGQGVHECPNTRILPLSNRFMVLILFYCCDGIKETGSPRERERAIIALSRVRMRQNDVKCQSSRIKMIKNDVARRKKYISIYVKLEEFERYVNLSSLSGIASDCAWNVDYYPGVEKIV